MTRNWMPLCVIQLWSLAVALSAWRQRLIWASRGYPYSFLMTMMAWAKAPAPYAFPSERWRLLIGWVAETQWWIRALSGISEKCSTGTRNSMSLICCRKITINDQPSSIYNNPILKSSFSRGSSGPKPMAQRSKSEAEIRSLPSRKWMTTSYWMWIRQMVHIKSRRTGLLLAMVPVLRPVK